MNKLADRLRVNLKRNYRKGFATLVTITLIASTGIIFEPTTAVALVADGQEATVKTSAETVDEFLSDVGVDVTSEDYVSVPLHTEIEEDMTIEVVSSKDITVIIDGVETEIATTELTVGEALESAGIEVSEKDIIEPSLDTVVEQGMEIEIIKAFPVTVNDGGTTTEIVTTPCTVEEFLTANGIVLNEFDVVTPALDQQLTPGVPVEITRINKYQVQEEAVIPYETTTVEDANEVEGFHNVDVQGQEGLALNTYNVVEVNGEVQEKTLASSTTTKEPVTQVERIGTKKPTEFYVEATAYTIPDGQDVAYTATGMPLTRDPGLKVIAVDPDVIPLGTKVYVEGYGMAIAADTGGAIQGNKIDVFLPTEEECISYGRQTVKVTIME